MAVEPARPRAPDRRRENELVPEFAQPVGLDVVADFVFGSFADDLPVDACAARAVVEVVGDRRAAPADVEWQLDLSAGLR